MYMYVRVVCGKGRDSFYGMHVSTSTITFTMPAAYGPCTLATQHTHTQLTPHIIYITSLVPDQRILCYHTNKLHITVVVLQALQLGIGSSR